VRAPALLLLALCLAGCVGVAPGIAPVENFDVSRYLGKWYEIARLDHSFERGMERVTAEYSLREDGGIRVINSGYSTKSGERRVAEGKAFFVSDRTKGHLKVSFFGPFYGSYVVFELDQAGYEYAFVTSYDRSYLWLLSRKPEIDPALLERFIAVASDRGFDTSRLIRVNQK
jgi:apolipoprotein D and lipocalin family protein